MNDGKSIKDTRARLDKILGDDKSAEEFLAPKTTVSGIPLEAEKVDESIPGKYRKFQKGI